MGSYRVWLALILLVTFGVYARSIGNDFAYDDRHYVMVPAQDGLPNELVAEWQGFSRYFSSFYGEGAVSGGRGFRPVTVMSFALVHQMFKPTPGQMAAGPPQPVSRPGPQHFANVALHVLATLLVFLLFRRLFDSPWPAVAATACFGLHALRSDPVISLVGRAEILALCFGISAQLLYLGALAQTGGARALRFAGTAACLFLAFCSKESSVPWIVFLPMFAAACRWQRDPSVSIGASLREQIVPVTIVAVVPLVAFLVLWYPILSAQEFNIVTVNNVLQRLEYSERFYTAVMILGYAVFQILLPFWLHVDYSFNAIEPVLHWYDGSFLTAFVVLTAILIGGVVSARRFPPLFLATAILFGFALLTSNIPMIVETIYGERLMYTPGIALCFVVAWVTEVILRKKQRDLGRLLLGIAALWIAASSILIIYRCGVWKDNRTLFLHEAETQPRSRGMQMAAGREFRLEGQAIGFEGRRGQECLRRWHDYLKRALEVHPARNHPLALNDLAYFHLVLRDKHLDRGDVPNAEKEERIAEQFVIAALDSPWYEESHGRTLHYHMSRIFERRGNREGQLRALQFAQKSDPKDPEGYTLLADWHLAAGQNSKAVEFARAAVAKFPDALPIRVRGLQIADDAGDSRALVEFLEDGERRHPEGNPHLQVFRGLLLARSGQHRPALGFFQSALPRFRSPPPPAVWLAVPESLVSIGEKQQALQFLGQHLRDPSIPQKIRAKMVALQQRLSQ